MPHTTPTCASVPPLLSQPLQQASTAASQHAKCLTVNAYVNSKFSRIRIGIDLATIDSVAVADAKFKKDHAVFPRAMNTSRSRYGALQGRWEFELACNELSWKLAWLNKSRLKGRRPLIQKCLDAYRAKFSTPPWALLACYKDQMNESVDPRFFDYWTPRPGRRALNAGPVTDAQPTDECAQDSTPSLLHSALSLSSTNAPSRPLSAVTIEHMAAEQPHPASQQSPEPMERPPSSSGTDSAARMRIIRPKSGSGHVAATATATATTVTVTHPEATTAEAL
ncbi:hypothetical protein GGI21_004704, partial [Coemansia aciculifera]